MQIPERYNLRVGRIARPANGSFPLPPAPQKKGAPEGNGMFENKEQIQGLLVKARTHLLESIELESQLTERVEAHRTCVAIQSGKAPRPYSSYDPAAETLKNLAKQRGVYVGVRDWLSSVKVDLKTGAILCPETRPLWADAEGIDAGFTDGASPIVVSQEFNFARICLGRLIAALEESYNEAADPTAKEDDPEDNNELDIAERAERRRSVIYALWERADPPIKSAEDWAARASEDKLVPIDKNTPRDFLNGKTRNLREVKKIALAKPLGISPSEMPD